MIIDVVHMGKVLLRGDKMSIRLGRLKKLDCINI